MQALKISGSRKLECIKRRYQAPAPVLEKQQLSSPEVVHFPVKKNKKLLKQLGKYVEDGIIYHDVVVEGSKAWVIVSDDRYLGMVDISDPRNPTLERTYRYTGLYYIAMPTNSSSLIVGEKHRFLILNMNLEGRDYRQVIFDSGVIGQEIIGMSATPDKIYLLFRDGYQVRDYLGRVVETISGVFKQISSGGGIIYILSDTSLIGIRGSKKFEILVSHPVSMIAGQSDVVVFTEEEAKFFKVGEKFQLHHTDKIQPQDGIILDPNNMIFYSDDQVIYVSNEIASEPYVCELSTHINDIAMTLSGQILLAAEREFIVLESTDIGI
jgi:hypothetical protein